MKVTPEILKGMDIFEFLTIDGLKDIAEMCQIEEFEAGALVFKDGDKADKLYMLLEGRVSIEVDTGAGRKASVYTLTRGKFFGYPALIRPRYFTTYARCMDKVKVVSLLADDLVNKIFKEDCRRGYLVMNKCAELVAQKLHETRMQLLSLVHG
jgi:CRP/FNR family transcriptional regulator